MESLVNTCDFSGVRPIMMELPYPPVQVRGRNQTYANILSIDYCGSVSELSAITQYINYETRICGEMCSAAKTLLGIAMAEMIHLQKLGELIVLLGGKLDFSAKHQSGKQPMWTPEYLPSVSENMGKMLSAAVEAEKAAIRQYRMHIKAINDPDICAVLGRIIRDEEYHIMLLQALAK